MGFLYPRTVAITRPGQQGGAGFQPTQGADLKANETPVATGLPASIQFKREGTKNLVGLPGDGAAPTWDVFIPKRALANGSVKDRDIVTDDLAERYQVLGNYWNSLGYRLRCVRLEA